MVGSGLKPGLSALHVQRPVETITKLGRQEGVDDGVHAGIGIRQHVGEHFGVHEGERLRDREEVNPQPHNVVRGPADAEHDHYHYDELGDLPLGLEGALSGRAVRALHGPQLLDHQDAQDEDSDEREGETQ